MFMKPYNELTKKEKLIVRKEKLIVKYENILSDFRDMLGLDLMEYIDSDWKKTTGEFFPMEESEILEDSKVRQYIFKMYHRVMFGDESYYDIGDTIDDDIFWDTYRDLLEYLENKYC